MVGTKAVRSWPLSWSRKSSMEEMIFMGDSVCKAWYVKRVQAGE
jgi:hypothetical protein